MLNKKNTILLIFSAVIIFGAFWYVFTHVYSINGNKIKTTAVGSSVFYAEVVASPEKLQKGLGGRESLCHSCAMLFQFSEAEKKSFWMKDMRFPLDIIWISSGKIVHIEKNVSEKFSGLLSPQVYADQVLEINAGLSDKIGLKEGSEVTF
jgi:uncharacterized protein